MHTEITNNSCQAVGWVFYDGECRLCLAWVARLRGILARRRFQIMPLQSPDAARRLNMTGPVLLTEMRLLLPDGRNFGGADAIVEIARHIWWAWPLWAISRFPGFISIMRAAYRVLAANRHCLNGACQVTRRSNHLDWLPLVVLPTTAIVFQAALPDWVFMWVLAFAIFFGCKWLTLQRVGAGGTGRHRTGAIAYLFLWPGMAADTFLEVKVPRRPALRNWAGAAAKTVAGAGLLWFAASRATTMNSLLIGWLGMFGVVLLLHFGLFHLLALFWQTTGRDVKPVMRAPLLATSLADFWGNRWNTAFNTLAHDLAFRPLVRRIDIRWATLGVFFISGLIHDLVISLPTRGGYGLPTAYFLVQGAAVLLERSHAGRAFGLGCGGRGRAFMLFMTAAPVFLLFHSMFIRNVILPMLQAIGETWNTL